MDALAGPATVADRVVLGYLRNRGPRVVLRPPPSGPETPRGFGSPRLATRPHPAGSSGSAHRHPTGFPNHDTPRSSGHHLSATPEHHQGTQGSQVIHTPLPHVEGYSRRRVHERASGVRQVLSPRTPTLVVVRPARLTSDAAARGHVRSHVRGDSRTRTPDVSGPTSGSAAQARSLTPLDLGGAALVALSRLGIQR